MHEIAQFGDNMHEIAKNLIKICGVGGRCEVEIVTGESLWEPKPTM